MKLELEARQLPISLCPGLIWERNSAQAQVGIQRKSLQYWKALSSLSVNKQIKKKHGVCEKNSSGEKRNIILKSQRLIILLKIFLLQENQRKSFRMYAWVPQSYKDMTTMKKDKDGEIKDKDNKIKWKGSRETVYSEHTVLTPF